MTEAGYDLERVIALATELARPDDAALLAAFTRAFLRGVDRVDAGGERALALRVAEAFAFAARRAPGAIEVRVTSPPEHPGRTLIQMLQDDRPFIVDTTRLLLGRLDLRERLFLHPIYGARCDGEGRLVGLDDGAGGLRESLLHVEVSPRIEAPARLADLAARLRAAMEQVRAVTDDFAAMVAALRELGARSEVAVPRLPDGRERARRVRTFLDWLIDGHFVFMGLRRYALRAQADGGMEVQLVPGSGLGLFRSDADSRLREPRRGDDIPDELRDVLEDPRILVVGKSRVESPIHRAGRLDRLAITEYDDAGRPSALTLVFGLFTSLALRTPGSKVPLLSDRLAQILRDERVEPRSHRHRALFAAFDSAPLEVLLGRDVEGVAALMREIVGAEGSQAARLVLRADRRGRSLYAAVLLPRERYGEELRGELRALLAARTGATWIDDRASFIEEGTAVVHFFCTSATALTLPDPAALEAEVQALAASWEDRLLEALVARFGEVEGAALAARYEDAFPPELRVATDPRDAVRDVEALEALARDGGPRFALFFARDEAARETTTLRLFLPAARLLSELLPVVDGFGIRVVDAQQVTVAPADRAPVAVHTLRVLPLGADQADLDAIEPRLSGALGAALSGAVASDPLNGLVLGAGLDWREVDVVRAQLEYFLQVQGALTRPFVRTVLLENPLAVRLLVQLHAARIDPAVPEAERAAREEKLRRAFEGYRDRISSLNEDRALAGLLSIVEATLRSNAFAALAPGVPHVLAFKIDPAKVPEIAAPRPHREIFVHSVEQLGVHIRGGPIARGGLRWSDRLDDLRVEILGLMRTQMLKNGLIVPVGAKGGFVLRGPGLPPREARARADEQYRVFVARLLDLTDDLDASGAVVPPPGIVRRDGDDPYLVVAADKGTAHLSDTANAIAQERSFWLGDAFASGGSNGYDHKKYAITARGAWECARHHLAELGVDPERDAYTATGIGDMSGDVFGNGLLLMRRVKLLGAFDHRHVFVDPDPDPAAAWAERKRLFEKPGSSWADYDPAKLSPGGGVFARGAKSIELAPAVRERLGLGPGRLSGPDVVRALLALDVDLLWNGGIGTYVKAGHESQADVGDRANDAVRIDAAQLRARVVAEGGNLGFTQAARVEAALAGVRIETDSVDNSAGVDLSDHEVNYKILLAPLVRAGKLRAEERHRAIHAAADDACASVLAHNRGQALALSLDELRARRSPGAFLRAIEELCEAAELDPAGLRLPDAKALAARSAAGRSLLRPELAVLLGIAKLVVRRALAASPWAAAPYLEPLLRGYFPPRFQAEWPAAIGEHPLRREITALAATNRLVDAGGVTLVPALAGELGVPLADAAAAALLAEDVLDAPARRAALLALGRPTPRVTVYGALLEVDRGVRAAARYLSRSGALALDAARVESLRTGLAALQAESERLLTPGELGEAAARRAALAADGLPSDLAAAIAAAALADRGLNVLRVCERTGAAPLAAGRVLARIGEGAGILWLHQRLRAIDASDPWDRMALADLRWELLDLQRGLAEAVLRAHPADPAAAADTFLTRHEPLLAQVRELQEEAGASPPPSALVVIASRLRALRA